MARELAFQQCKPGPNFILKLPINGVESEIGIHFASAKFKFLRIHCFSCLTNQKQFLFADRRDLDRFLQSQQGFRISITSLPIFLEQFLNDCRKTKTKVKLLRFITVGAISAMNQSECLKISCNLFEAREKSHVRGVIGFSLASHCLKNRREIPSANH